MELLLLIKQSLIRQGKKVLLIISQLVIGIICLLIGIGMIQATKREIMEIQMLAPSNMFHLAYYADVRDIHDLRYKSFSDEDLYNFYNLLKSDPQILHFGTFLTESYMIDEKEINIIYVDAAMIEIYDFRRNDGSLLAIENTVLEYEKYLPVLISSELIDSYPLETIINKRIDYNEYVNFKVVGILEPNTIFWGGNSSYLSDRALLKNNKLIISPMIKSHNFEEKFEMRVLYNNIIIPKQPFEISEFSLYLQNKVDNVVGGNNFKLKVVGIEDEIERIYERNKFTIMTVLLFAFVLLSLSSLGLLGMVLVSIMFRMYEFGIRYTLGSTSSKLGQLIFGEILLLYIIASIISVVFSLIFVSILPDDMTVIITASTIISSIFIVSFFIIISSLIPIIKIIYMEPITLITGGRR